MWRHSWLTQSDVVLAPHNIPYNYHTIPYERVSVGNATTYVPICLFSRIGFRVAIFNMVAWIIKIFPRNGGRVCAINNLSLGHFQRFCVCVWSVCFGDLNVPNDVWICCFLSGWIKLRFVEIVLHAKFDAVLIYWWSSFLFGVFEFITIHV